MNSEAIPMPAPDPASPRWRRSNDAAPSKPADALGITQLRANIWSNGFRSVAVYNPVTGDDKSGKRPVGNDWTGRARQNPPEAATALANLRHGNTGILAEGPRPIDIDIDDTARAAEARRIVEATIGKTIVRTRSNSGRCMLIYRAAEGQPAKRSITGTHGKVEVLGLGNQFVAYGKHYTGVNLEWPNGGPDVTPLAALPLVSEAQITALLAALAPIVGAEPPKDASPPQPAAAAAPSSTRITAEQFQRQPHVEATAPDGEVVNLTIWKAKHPKRFLLPQAVQHHCPEMILGKSKPSKDGRSPLVPCRCPNEGAHTIEHYDGDTSTVMWDACSSQDFGFKCHHGCAGSDHDNLGYLKQLIEQGHLPISALTDDRFLIPLPETSVNKSKWLFGSDMLSKLYERPPEIIPGFIGVGTMTVVSGPQGTGKSALLSTAAFCMVSGAPECMGFPVRPARVAILAGEGANRTIHDFAANCLLHGRDISEIMNAGFGIHKGSLPINTPGGRAELLAWLEGFKERFGGYPDVVIIDTARKNLRGSVSDDEHVGEYYETLEILTGMRISTVTAAHTAKGGGSTSTKGSSDWEQGADYVVHVSGKVRAGKTKVFFEKVKTGNDGHSFEVTYEYPDVPGVGTTPVPVLLTSTPFNAASGADPQDDAAQQSGAEVGVWVAEAKRILDNRVGLDMAATELAEAVMAATMPDLEQDKEREKYTKVRDDTVRKRLVRAFRRDKALHPYVADWTKGGDPSSFHNPVGPRRARGEVKKCCRRKLPRPNHPGTGAVQ
ncbi:AAA family ATPase [Rhodopila sp.]|uniref:AAA family ATPase n=1 Tax=Rhodopila sp. TaxID=2480087 RepID=UPI003D0D8039